MWISAWIHTRVSAISWILGEIKMSKRARPHPYDFHSLPDKHHYIEQQVQLAWSTMRCFIGEVTMYMNERGTLGPGDYDTFKYFFGYRADHACFVVWFRHPRLNSLGLHCELDCSLESVHKFIDARCARVATAMDRGEHPIYKSAVMKYAKEAISVAFLCMKQLGLLRDMRIFICKMLWNKYYTWMPWLRSLTS
jgi:hypothetical protein